jgi:ribose transport system ATP-binding protein
VLFCQHPPRIAARGGDPDREVKIMQGVATPSDQQASDEATLEFCELSKRFGGTLAVDDVSLAVRPGEILALLGENGAGKSTLIKMLAGVHTPDQGGFRLRGAPYDPRTGKGIAFIHQDLGLLDWMTVAENIAMGQGFPRRLGLIDWPAVERTARRSLALIAHGIDPAQRVGELTRTEKSLVAIARALGSDADVLVLDEPTASLPQDEVEILFGVLRDLKRRGVSMIYVSHRLDEVFAISDRLAVLRDGRLVALRETATTDPAELIRLIIGRPPESMFVRPRHGRSEPLLSVRRLRVGEIGPLDLSLAAGEIVALAGLRGAGQEACGRALFGLLASAGGEIFLAGQPLATSTPPEAIRAGIGFVAGDRSADSIGRGLSVRENIFLNPMASGRKAMSWRRPGEEAEEARRLGASVGLFPNNPDAVIETLSGGNQQKVVVARWLRIGGRVLVLEDPTAGVDVGAKAEIYRLIGEAVAAGLGVLLVSTDFEEVAAICHRALVFRDGRIVAELPEAALSVEALIHAASLPATASERRVA